MNAAALGAFAIGLSMAVSSAARAEEPSAQALELAERIVALQRMREFMTIEWQEQMNWFNPDTGPDDFGVPEEFIQLAREQTIEAPAQEWANVLARSLEVPRLAGIVRLLERPAYQDWMELQLELHPEFIVGMMEEAVATGEVLVEEFNNDPPAPGATEREPTQSSGTDSAGSGVSIESSVSIRSRESIASIEAIEPIVESPLSRAFEYVPGSRVDANLEGQRLFEKVRLPVDGGPLAVAFDDYFVNLLPDGDAARVVSISAERAFSSESACEAKRRQLESSLAVLFDRSEETDCGFLRYLAHGGDTTMSLHCTDRSVLGEQVELSFGIRHEPTENARFAHLMATTRPADDEADRASESP
jgi:hypothetical protein